MFNNTAAVGILHGQLLNDLDENVQLVELALLDGLAVPFRVLAF